MSVSLQVAQAVREADEAEARRAEGKRGPLRDHRPLVLNQDDFLVGPGVWQMPFSMLHEASLDAVAPALPSARLYWTLAGFPCKLRGVVIDRYKCPVALRCWA